MLAEATGENPPFRQVLVHDEGRLCGREAELRARLEGHGVRVMSITDPAGAGMNPMMNPASTAST